MRTPLVILSTFFAAFIAQGQSSSLHLPAISGHRGGAASGYPENCIQTFEHTLSATPAFFEVDPHLTKDSGIVLLHDATLERMTTGHGKLNDFTLDQVEKLQLKDVDGKPTPLHLNTLEEAIRWSKGKTVLNLDVKDVPLISKAELVRKYDAFGYILFTVHTPEEARIFYDYDHRSLFSAFIMNENDLRAYETAGIPWANLAIAYVGPLSRPENKGLYTLLHNKGIKVMVSAAPSYDKLDDPAKRAEAYRQILRDGADIIESDRPIEAAAAIRSLNK